MKHLIFFCCVLPLPILLANFFLFDRPTWEKINKSIDQDYKTVTNIDIDSLKSSLDQGRPPILIDVRGTDEFAVSHLPNAINMNRIHEVAYAKDTPLVIYCSVGVRSADFAKRLGEEGFTKVSNLRGSIFAWANKGYPLQRGTMAVKVVHPYNKKWGRLLNPELHMYSVDTPDTTGPGTELKK